MWEDLPWYIERSCLLCGRDILDHFDENRSFEGQCLEEQLVLLDNFYETSYCPKPSCDGTLEITIDQVYECRACRTQYWDASEDASIAPRRRKYWKIQHVILGQKIWVEELLGKGARLYLRHELRNRILTEYSSRTTLVQT